MDRQDQRKRAFSQAFQLMNQPRLGDTDAQATKRILSCPLRSVAPYYHDFDQEKEPSLDPDCGTVFEQIPGTQIRRPPPIDLKHLNPALYNYASLQYELYGNGPRSRLEPGVGAMSPPISRSRYVKATVQCESDLPTPQFVRGKSFFGPSPYIRSDSSLSPKNVFNSYTQSRDRLAIYENGDSPMSDTLTAVSPLTPSALRFGDLSLESQRYSLPSSPLRNGGHENRAAVKIVPTSSFASLFPDINPNDVIVLFGKGKEARKIDKYPLCSASRFFTRLLDGPFLDPSLTRCIRLRNDFPYAITTMIHFIETGNYMCDPEAFAKHPLLTTLDFHIHAYLIGSKYDISGFRDHAINAYLSIAEHEMKLGFMALSGGRLSDIEVPVPGFPILSAAGHIDGEPMTMPIDRFLNSVVLLWKNTHSRYDIMRKAVLELIKRDLNKLLRLPFFVTLMTEMVGFGDDVVMSLSDDGFEVKAFQIPVGGRQRHAMWFGVQ